MSSPQPGPLSPFPPNKPPPSKILSRNSRRRLSSSKSFDSDISSLQSRPTSSSLSRYSVLPEINNSVNIPFTLPEQPNTGGLHIGIKLFDGSKIYRTFNPDDKLLDLLKFASNSTNENMTNYKLFNPLNRMILTDLYAFLKDIKIPDKTILFIHIPD